MDDLTEKLTAVLNNPEMMAQIKSLSGLLNTSNNTDQNKLQSAISDHPEIPSTPEGTENTAANQQINKLSPEMITQIMKFAPLISNFNKDDKYTEFLYRLRPLLNKSKQIKLDNALKFFKIIRLIPILKNQGIL